MTYEAWRATHQDAEAAAKAAFEQVQGLAKLVDGLQAALGRQVRFGMGELEKQGMRLVNAGASQMVVNALRRDAEEGKPVRGEMADELLTAIAPRVQQAPTATEAEAPQALDALRREIENVTRWLPADVDCGGVWAALDAIQATPTADMGNTISQPPSATEAGNPASGAQDKMPPTQQPEALRLAELIRLSGALPGSVSDDAASELRRLHAENQDLRTRHYCNTAEIESLQARVQELGEIARENRSKRVIELEQRIAEMEEQMAAIGAGGVEPLRGSRQAHECREALAACINLLRKTPKITRDIYVGKDRQAWGVQAKAVLDAALAALNQKDEK